MSGLIEMTRNLPRRDVLRGSSRDPASLSGAGTRHKALRTSTPWGRVRERNHWGR